ncbi:hypothetical protein [Rhodanobacter lindaniclasticus]|jgi:hypothetical protein|uniref:hypothetical protein n=1 Tax=Rhodanobacter lindaniclasticus TaxID=75310 RepID=UPI0010A03AD3|nr:hypothetical protein [Rhodanobacter lindaniclasticus]
MSSLWTDLLFLHGHITDARLARRLAVPERASPPPAVKLLARLSLRRLRRFCRSMGSRWRRQR